MLKISFIFFIFSNDLILVQCQTMPIYQLNSIANAQSQSVTVTIGFILPSQSLADSRTREQLRQFLAVNQQRVTKTLTSTLTYYDNTTSTTRKLSTSSPPITYRLRVNPVYASGVSLGELIRNVFCSRAAEGINALFILVDKALQNESGTRLANLVTTLANTAGIPTMSWSSASNELEDAANNGPKNFKLMLAPPTRNQAQAIFAFFQTYQWRRFSILAPTSTPGHDIFITELRDLATSDEKSYARFSFDSHQQHQSGKVIRTVKMANTSRENIRAELLDLRDNTDTRIIVLFANLDDANAIFEEARMLGMTSGEYLWICAKPVLGNAGETALPSLNFTPGTIAVTYNTTLAVQHEALRAATKLWSDAMEKFTKLNNVTADRLAPRMSCDGSAMKAWAMGDTFYNILKSTSLTMFDETVPGFDDNGLMNLGAVALLNLDTQRNWKKIGEWTHANGLLMDDITWPAGPGKPPSGRPDATILKIATLEEPPYVVYEPPDPVSGICPRTAVPCRLSPVVPIQRSDEQNATSTLVLSGEVGPMVLMNDSQGRLRPATSYNFINPTGSSHPSQSPNGSWVCCVGFCMDLLRRLSTDIGFRFEVYEVHDRKWGAIDRKTGQWNGLVQALMETQADMVVTSLKISKERSTAIDFSVPFLETGITILVRVREGVISPVAFLEPFSIGAWVVVLIGCVNSCALFMFTFEYFSPRGLDRGQSSSIPHKFSLFRSLWLVWAMLFKAAVKVDIPRGIGARMMANIWGMFCVIFMSSYMANLAAFMITKEDFHDFTGIDDIRLKNPYSKNPPWKYATIPSGATEAIIKHNFPEMFEYMRVYNRSTADDGMWAVKKGDLDAFIYDATVLEYKAGRDKECRLRTVGKWYAMTGYGIAFPKGSKWLPIVNKYIIDYQHTGYLQQLQEFWLTGACKERQKQESTQSQELGILNFTSAFIMLAVGLITCSIFLFLEHLYVKYGRRHLRKVDKCGLCGLISLNLDIIARLARRRSSMGASLSFKDTVQGALWRMQNDTTPCTSNSCQFQQEFLKAQLRRVKSQLRIMETHLCVGAATSLKRETTFGPDDPSESPVVDFKIPPSANNGGQTQLVALNLKVTPSKQIQRSAIINATTNGHAHREEQHQPAEAATNAVSYYSHPHQRFYVQNGNNSPSGLYHRNTNRANGNRGNYQPLLQQDSHEEADNRSQGNYSIGSYRPLPQSTSTTSSNVAGTVVEKRNSHARFSDQPQQQQQQQPLIMPRSVSFGTTTTYIATSPASSSGEGLSTAIVDVSSAPYCRGEIETNL